MRNGSKSTLLSLRNVRKHFGGVKAVCGIDLDVTHGERRVIIGPNGAGKTTLFNLISGDLSVTEGTIKIDDTDVTNLSSYKRVKFGMERTYQTTTLFDGLTVEENLYLSLLGSKGNLSQHLNVFKNVKRDSDYLNRVNQTAENVNLQDKINTLAGELSHGERRQLSFGMAVINKPRLLLLDEPAAGLSTNERDMLLKLLKKLDSDITIILIEHDIEIAFEVAEKITVLNEGSVVVSGTPNEIHSNELVQEIYLGG